MILQGHVGGHHQNKWIENKGEYKILNEKEIRVFFHDAKEISPAIATLILIEIASILYLYLFKVTKKIIPVYLHERERRMDCYIFYIFF
jgi:hypothetical protein